MNAPPAHLFEIDASWVADTSDDYYTPRWIFDAAGLMFDMDVSAPVDPSRRTCPARRYLTPVEDGLTAPWEGLVWMNPPYSAAARWVDRFVTHPSGLALLPVVQEVYWMGVLLGASDAMTMLSVRFRPNARPPFPFVLAGRGACSDAVARVAAADRYMRGAAIARVESRLEKDPRTCANRPGAWPTPGWRCPQ